MKKSNQVRRLASVAGVLLISLGLFGWQAKAFLDRKQAAAAQAEAEQAVDFSKMAWHEAPKEVRAGVTAAIKGQLEAFKKNDFQAASNYQSVGLRAKFQSPEAFGLAIKGAYPQFANYKSVTFLFVNADEEEHKYSNAGVRVTGVDGVRVDAVYQMVREDDQWRVGGVNTPVKFGVAPPAKGKKK